MEGHTLNAEEILAERYAEKIRPILPLAQKAYGSRATQSPQHDASRLYTKYLVEYYGAGGSLQTIADKLDVTYTGLRRRVTTNELPVMEKRVRVKFTDEEYKAARERLQAARDTADSETYHDTIKAEYERGMSLARLARELGLGSSNPLYYGLHSAIRRQQNGV